MKTQLRHGLIITLLTFILTFAAASKALAAETYVVDPDHSSAIFKVRHMGISNVQGAFNTIAGTIVANRAKPAASSVEIRIETNSVDTHNDRRDNHLRSADFFDVQKYPQMSFKSKKVRKINNRTVAVTGDFTLHGVTKTITVKVQLTGEGKDPQGNARIGFETQFSIKRSDYGMSGYPGVVGDKVDISLAVEAIKK